jgi:hypothetical protein
MSNEKSTTAQSNTSKSAPKAAPPKVNFKAPAGFVDQNADVVGFYDPEVEPVIHFVPIEAVLSDSNLDETKVSILIFGKLTEPCKLVETVKSGNVVSGAKGDMVGIWAKPGMRALRNLGGEPVIMYPDGERDTGKPNKMIAYKVLAAKKAGKLPIVEDRRDKSKNTETWLDARHGETAPF